MKDCYISKDVKYGVEPGQEMRSGTLKKKLWVLDHPYTPVVVPLVSCELLLRKNLGLHPSMESEKSKWGA